MKESIILVICLTILVLTIVNLALNLSQSADEDSAIGMVVAQPVKS